MAKKNASVTDPSAPPKVPRVKKPTPERDVTLSRAFLLTFVNERLNAETPMRAVDVVKATFGRFIPAAIDDLAWLHRVGLIKILSIAGKAESPKIALVMPVQGLDGAENVFKLVNYLVSSEAKKEPDAESV